LGKNVAAEAQRAQRTVKKERPEVLQGNSASVMQLTGAFASGRGVILARLGLVGLLL
jgi:hydroxyethylthiazole kinase-like sugar kinase family protein